MRRHRFPYGLLLGWAALIAARAGVGVAFHAWSLARGRHGLAPVVIGGDDGDYYLFAAEWIAETGQLPDFVPSLWPVLVGWLMEATGWRGVLPFKVLLFIASVGTAVVGVRLLRLVMADTLGRRPGTGAELVTAAALMLFPSTLWVSTYSIYRDAVIFFLTLASVYVSYRVLVRKRSLDLPLLAATLGGLAVFRWYAALAVAAGAVAWMLLTGGTGRDRWKRRLAAALLVVAAASFVVASGYLGHVEGMLASRDLYESQEGGSNLGLSYSQSSPWTWPAIYAYTFLTNVLGPLPNQIDGVTTAMGFVFEVPLLAFVLWRVLRSPLRRRREVQLVLAVALVWFLLIAIYNDNVGTGLRLRVVGYQLLFVVAVADHERRRLGRLARRAASRSPRTYRAAAPPALHSP